ncbi:MAG: alpha/beta hydrolase [Chloroflexota bacterium]
MATGVTPARRTLVANGLDLSYLEWGGAGATPLVCVHGYTGSADAFSALARSLGEGFHIVAPDVRGHGESGWSADEAYEYADQANDLLCLVDALGFERFALIGTSMGGIISMAFALEQANRLTHLVLNDIGPDVEGGSGRITQMVGSRPDSFKSLDDAMEYRRSVSPIVAGRTIADQRELALGVLREGPDGVWRWKMDPAYIRRRVERGAPKRPDAWPVLARLACPTMVVWGATSDVLSEAQARRMVEALPRGVLVEVPGVGHAPTLIEPVVLDALKRFLPS